MSETTKKQERTLVINVPVYTTTVLDRDDGIYGVLEYKELINLIKTRIKNYTEKISYNYRNKTKTTYVKEIIPHERTIGDRPVLLLQIKAYNTNIYDGYFESEQKIPIDKDAKIGSDSNYVLMYPLINGLTKTAYQCYFLLFVYEDPTKDKGQVSKLAKVVAANVLNFPVENVKLPSILEEIAEIKSIPELQVVYKSVQSAEDETDVEVREYIQKQTIFKKKESIFSNIPFLKVKPLLDDYDDEYQSRDVRIIIGKKEYKITKEIIKEASEEYKETGEKVFNEKTAIKESELIDGSIFDVDYIVDKLSGVLQNYLSNGE